MPFDPLFSAIEEFQVYIMAGAFALARMLGLVLLMPLFSRLRLTGLLRTGVALALAIPLVPMLARDLESAEIGSALAVAYMLKEVVVGATIGLAMGIPIWAAEAAGDILDLQRGSTMGSLVDPMMTHETSATGTFLAIVMMALFLAAGGLELMLDSAYGSYSLWPVERLFPVFSGEAGVLFLELLNQLLAMALTMAFPLIFGMLLSDLVLAFLAKASPHLNVFALSLIVKTLVFSLVFVLYATFLVSYMSRDLGFLRDLARQIEAISCVSCP